MNTANDRFSDRRSAKRQNARFSVRFRPAEDPSIAYQAGTTIDISAKSLAFESPEIIRAGSKIAGEVAVPFLEEPIKFSGPVIRVEVREGGKYLYAVIFESIRREDQQALEAHIHAIDLGNILRSAIKADASDVHFIADKPHYFRIHGELVPAGKVRITSGELKELILGMLTPQQREELETNLELNFSYTIAEGNHFRVNVHWEKGNLEAAMRVIPTEIKTVAELGLPSVVETLSRRKYGLILVTGVAGSGKTTTQASMIDIINREMKRVIISIEDPIEFVHESKHSIVKQREVGADTLSFANGLKQSLRQDPNVIFIGEMRDLETIATALTAAETGHLVLTTLHTMGAAESVKRIVDVFPAEQQMQVYSLLAVCLEGIISQVLLPRKNGRGRVVATEVLIATPAIRNLIRTGKIEQIQTYLDTGSQEGMHSLDTSLADLVRRGLLDEEMALSFARDKNRIRSYLLKK